MIKKVLFVLLLLSNIVTAETKMEYKISFVGMNMDYREYDRSGNILDSEKSNYLDVIGAEFEYRYFLDERSNIDFKVLGVEGESEYVGSYIGSGAGYGSVVSTTSNAIRDISLGYNATNISDFNIMMLGGLGLGYRYWQRTLSSTQVEVYEWYSLRANVGMRFVHKNLTASLIAEYQYGIKPTMTATGIADDFELSSANIVKLSLPIRYMISENIDLICTYVFEYQEIQESNVVYDAAANGYVEPDSTAYNQYLKVGMVFKY
ncbi:MULTISPECIES: hypothetical protein [Sulfurimonas]|uniref:hypothetical protein n=1 Tax=Sulfurimonas TaxID=202746 RepID=UPI00126482AF|nr:hypothetical protein [Sulfurimonas indica]